MNDEERYLFDLTGYLLIENVLTPEEIALANEAIDRHADQMRVRPPEQTLAAGSPALVGEKGRTELGGMLHWERPWCDPFRLMLAHPRIVPCLNAILGKGFRMDHQMFLLQMGERAGTGRHGTALPHPLELPDAGRMTEWSSTRTAAFREAQGG